MAGWMSWDSLFNEEFAQTVTESLMPEATAIANRFNLNDSKRLHNAMVSVVMFCKKIEYDCLNEDRTAAILSGEFWANSFYHTKVLRFDKETDAWNWALKHLENRPLEWSTSKVNLINEEMGGILTDKRTLTTATPENIVRVFYKYVQGGDDLKLEGLVYYVCGLAKKGFASQAWFRDTLMIIQSKYGNIDFNLNSNVMSCVWRYYGVIYSPDNGKWPLLFEHIQSECEARSLYTLVRVVESTAFYGSTVMMMIKEARLEVKNFDWSLISNTSQNERFRVLHREMLHWEQDLEEFNKDPWKMFKPNAIGNSNKYLNLGYLSKKLLLVHGVKKVEKYCGLDNKLYCNIPLKFFIDELVDRYRCSHLKNSLVI